MSVNIFLRSRCSRTLLSNLLQYSMVFILGPFRVIIVDKARYALELGHSGIDSAVQQVRGCRCTVGGRALSQARPPLLQTWLLMSQHTKMAPVVDVTVGCHPHQVVLAWGCLADILFVFSNCARTVSTFQREKRLR